MKIIDKRGQEQETDPNQQENNVVPFARPLPGQKTPDDDWLSPLEPGTVFLCKKKDQINSPFFEEWHLVFKGEKGVRLVNVLNGTIKAWVDPMIWCKQVRLIEVLGRVINEPAEQESSGESDPQPIQS